MLAPPDVEPMLPPICAARKSASSSKSAAVIVVVPPARIWLPVKLARPILSGGSR